MAVVVLVLRCCFKTKAVISKDNITGMIFGQLKLIISFLQIMAATPISFNLVPWPSNFRFFTLSLGFVNLDLLGILPNGPNLCRLQLSPLAQFGLYMLILPLLLASCYVGFKIAVLTVCNNKERRNTMAVVWWEATIKLLILVVLLMYPGISTRVFTVFRCMRPYPGGPLVFAADFNVECFKEEHTTSVGIAGLSMFLYVLGIPATMLCILYKLRAHLHNTSSSRHAQVHFEFGGLYQQYEPAFWYFEIISILNKMMMTGMLAVIRPGTPLQMMVSVLCTLIYLLIILKLSPYKNNMDDFVAVLSSVAVTLTNLAGYALLTDAPAPNNFFNPSAVGDGLVTMTCTVFVIQVGNIVLLKFKGAKLLKKVAGKAKREMARRMTVRGTHVVPVVSKSPAINKAEEKAKEKEMEQLKNWSTTVAT